TTLVHGNEADSALSNLELAGDELVVAAARLGHRDGPPQRVAQLHEVHENNVVYDGADGELRHEVRHAEQLGVFIVEEGRKQVLLAVGYQGVEEIAVELLVLQRGTVTG